MKKFVLFLSLTLSSLVLTIAPCLAEEKSPEAAARQARIDRDQAQVKLDQLEQKEKEAIGLDGLDAIKLREYESAQNDARAEKEKAEHRLRAGKAVE